MRSINVCLLDRWAILILTLEPLSSSQGAGLSSSEHCISRWVYLHGPDVVLACVVLHTLYGQVLIRFESL